MRTRWTVYFRYRTWAEWMLSIWLCCSIIAIPPHRHTHIHRIFFSFFAENEGNDVESRSVIWIQRGKSVCVIVHAHVHVCAHAHVCTWECSPSWPADSLPSEILSEDYKTNQQTVIAAASLWLDHNPASAMGPAKRKTERGEERNAKKEWNEKKDKERRQTEPSCGWKSGRRQDLDRT